MKDVLHIFKKEQCKSLVEDNLVVVRDENVCVDLPNSKVMTFGEDFESLVVISIP